MTPTHCPHCGAEARTDYGFTCGWHPLDGFRTARCYERQIAALKAEVGRAWREAQTYVEPEDPHLPHWNQSRARRIATGELVAGKEEK